MATVVMIVDVFLLLLISTHCRDCFNSVHNNNNNNNTYISRCFARSLPLLLFPSSHHMVVSIASTVPLPTLRLIVPILVFAFFSLPFLFCQFRCLDSELVVSPS